ncbi:MAG: hypothetical protein HQM08_25575 [Candidatus Riflebacteria bacterium]|nr:hypothetical protein [Candidatus Riflebacteria bacterium]
MKKIILTGLLLVFFSSLSVFAWERFLVPDNRPTKVFEVYGWTNQLYGNMSVQGLNLNLENNVNLGTNLKFGARFQYPITKTNNLSLTFNYMDDSGTVNTGYTFKGVTYAAGSNLDITNMMFDLMGSREITRDRSGWFDFLYGMKIISTDINATKVTGASNRWTGVFPLPYLGLGGGTYITDRILLDGHLKYMNIRTGNGGVDSTDLDFNVSYRLNPYNKSTEWYGWVGYRNFYINGNTSGNNVNLHYSGPLFGIVSRWG